MRGVACLSSSAAMLLLPGTFVVEVRGNERNEGRRIKGRVEARGGGMESIYREQSTSRVEQLVRGSPGSRDKVGARAPGSDWRSSQPAGVRPTTQKPEASTATHVLRQALTGISGYSAPQAGGAPALLPTWEVVALQALESSVYV
jgi:hypothetical protein